ncbi:MAG: NPCBM/NEW2 domain-containing protein, partial [Erysipelotrichales bacterium]|nr:NPCBM/NEW2 domain-containing protein [Erysipelotrichales bacterium]
WTPTGSNPNVKYLSDMEIIDVLNNDDTSTKTNTSYVESGHQIRKDKNDQSKLITLLINGKQQSFIKGLSAWATSNLIYNIEGLGYTKFHAYVGVDYSQKDNTYYNSGVKFTIYTSEDGKEWTIKQSTGVLTAAGNATEINVDLTDTDKYLRLYADMNGNNWWSMWYDDAVYADAKLMKEGYTDSNTQSNIIKTVAEYDTEIKSQDINDISYYESTLLKREFVDRIGYDVLQGLIKYDNSYEEVIEWLVTDSSILKEFLLGGTPDGSYVSTLKILNELYHTYQNDINTPLYRKMMITLALTHSQAVGTWVTGAPENPDDPNGSNALVRYSIYKNLYETKKLDPLFERSSVEELRFVMNNIISDEEIDWLYWCTQQQKAGHFVGRTGDFMNPYTYVEYQGYDYSLPQYYDKEHYDEWNAKYHLSDFGIHYGYTKLWIVFEQGGVCGAIAKTGSNIRGVYGIPSTVVSQPGHAAYIYQRQDNNGNVIWELYNDVSGWAQSGKTEKLTTRMPLGWGTGNYTSGYEAAYILLAQAAIDDKNGSLEDAEELVMLAKVYANDTDKVRQIYKNALETQKLNLDAWLGLIRSYIKDGASQEEYLQAAKDVIDALTYYPRPMYDLLMLIRSHLEFQNQVVLDAMLDVALDKAIAATSNDVLQPNPARDVARYLKGNNTVEVATFSFDGEYAGQIRLADRYASGGVTWQYTLTGIDASKDWTDNGNWSASISEPYIQLSEDEIASITAENNILIRIVGAMNTVYTIDITKGTLPTTVYANDLENHIFGLSKTMEWRIIDSDTESEVSEEWTKFGEAEPNLKGTKTVEVRTGNTGTSLASNPVTFRFTPRGEDNPTYYYIPISRLSIKDYSSDQADRGDKITNLLDGNANTIWHTKWDGSDKEQYVIYELERPASISAIEYVPRQSGTAGIAKGLEIYFSMNGEDWEQIVSYADVSSNKTIDLKYWSDLYEDWYEMFKDEYPDYPEWNISHLTTKYIKIVNSSRNNAQYLSASAFNFFEDTALNETLPMVEI